MRNAPEVNNGSGIARAIDYSLKRWAALTHYVDDGRVPIDNNWIENQIRPIVLGRLPAQPYSRIGELLARRWQPSISA